MNINKWIALFPGQGSQFVGMSKKLMADPTGRALLKEANEVFGREILELIESGPEEELKKTINAQPAIFVISYGWYKLIEEKIGPPSLAAGHSLGELTALTAGGVFDYHTAIRVVKKRAELMEKATKVYPGKMAAIIGMKNSDVEDFITKLSNNNELSVANYNLPEQTVISGNVDAVEIAVEKLIQYSVKAIILSVSGAFHSKLMNGAAKEFSGFLDAIKFENSKFPIICNVNGKAETNHVLLKKNLVLQMANPVQWVATMETIKKFEINNLIEFGPGEVLSGLAKRFDKNFSINKAENLK